MPRQAPSQDHPTEPYGPPIGNEGPDHKTPSVPSPPDNRTTKRRRRPPKRVRDLARSQAQENCAPDLKRRKRDPEDDDEDKDQHHQRKSDQGTSYTAKENLPPPSDTPQDTSKESHGTSDADKEQLEKCEMIRRTNERIGADLRNGRITYDRAIAMWNLQLCKHPLFTDDFLIIGDQTAIPTAANHHNKTRGQRDLLRWLTKTGAMLEVPRSTPAFINYFTIEKKLEDSWRPLVNGKEMRSRGIQNPSTRYTSSPATAIRALAQDDWRWISDLRNGFQLIRCKTSRFMTTRIDGRVYQILSPAQGLPNSPAACNAIFEKAAREGGAQSVYADNFGGVARTLKDAQNNQTRCINYMLSLGFSINQNETPPPGQQVNYLGVIVGPRTVKLPPDKHGRYLQVLDNPDDPKSKGFYAYLQDLFGKNNRRPEAKLNDVIIYADGAKGGRSAAAAVCTSCENIVSYDYRSAKQKDQVTSETDALLLARRLTIRYGVHGIKTDALYAVEAQRSAKPRDTIVGCVSKQVPPLSFVRSEENVADILTRKTDYSGIPLCSC